MNPAPDFDYVTMAAELVNDEGLRTTVYDDASALAIVPGLHVVGHPTIGVGRALDVRGITMAEARMLLDNDLTNYVVQLRCLPWFNTLSPVRQRAVVNMRHQLGMTGLLQFRDMIDAITTHNWAAAFAAGAASVWAARQTPARAKRVLTMLMTGDEPPLP